MKDGDKYMYRCLQLAAKGAGYVAPNPLVGAVLVYNGEIIGEGWHQQYGHAHAEVNCIEDAVQKGNARLISQATLYVSLEPCTHFGKTPPCSDFIIQHRIPKVVIGCLDPFAEVKGKGVRKLKEAGIEAETDVLENQCTAINKRFFTVHTQHRPYIILKWAQTADGFIAGISESPATRLLISNEYTNRLVHKWRSEEAAILAGTNTAFLDDPQLTTRLWKGPSPIRLVVDMDLKLPASLKLFSGDTQTIVFNTKKHAEGETISYYQVSTDASLVHQVVNALYQLKIQSVLVEGGARLLQSFIDQDMWDEARIIINQKLKIGKGLPAPEISNSIEAEKISSGSDKIFFFLNGRKKAE
jgi:diaminohydroxyphosphoribosylaminopyrimidine deaminase / 5-amino-6-(5-phosphoribosylamino)uracil reductase